jgi:type I restriction enzyme S subunit
MNTKQLRPVCRQARQKILDLAIRGKLVPPACRQAGKTPDTLPQKENGAWFVYVIECDNGSFYKGFTEDLPNRWKQHCAGTAAEWTKKHKPKQVFYWEKHSSKESAIKREDYLKSGIGREWFKREVVDKPNDWLPASAILQRIRDLSAEQAGVASSDKSPYQNLSADRQNLPFEVPEGWKIVKLEEVCEIFGRIGFRGYTREDLVSEKEGVITLSPSNIIDGKMNYDKCTYISWFKYEQSPEIKILNNDILIVKTGSSYGKCALVENLPKEATINPQFVVLKNIKCDNSYLNYVLSSDYARQCFDDFVLGTAIPTFTQKNLGNLSFPLPPLAEQRRIVSVIESAFALIDEIEDSQTSLQQIIKQAKAKTLDLAIKGKLVSVSPAPTTADNSPYTNLPVGWVWCRLGEVGQVVTGSTPSKSNPNFYGNDYPFFKPTDLDAGLNTTKASDNLSKAGFEVSRKLPKNSILVCCIGTIGKIGMIQVDGTCNQQINAIIPNQTIIFPSFLFYLCHSNDVQKQLWDNSSATTIAILNKGNFEKTVIPLPPLPEQKLIVERIENIFSILDSIQENL